MQANFKYELKNWDWKNQTVWDENKTSIGSLTNNIENGYYQTKEVDIDLWVIDLSKYWFKTDDLFDFIIHYKLCQNANLDYPVIVNQKGTIIDWRHRLCKALIEGKKKLKGIMIIDSTVI
mgnify:CR=1 FL=1